MDQQWQPIATAPKDGRNLLVWWADFKELELAYWSPEENAWIIVGEVITIAPPSHWLAILQPPGWHGTPYDLHGSEEPLSR